MNIDYHFGIIYVIARAGGLDRSAARTVAHACQYVDDATTGGPLRFAGKQSFDRFASAHHMLDYQNLDFHADARVWAPFHFLPAAEGASLPERVVCRPDSAPARALAAHVLASRDGDNDLHRLGVMLHTYVDTWAHQGFSGIPDRGNKVAALLGRPWRRGQRGARARLAFKRGLDRMTAWLIECVAWVGHGAALHYPDVPWLRWSYRDADGRIVRRDNLADFTAAADMACRIVQAFVAGHADFAAMPGLGPARRADLRAFLAANGGEDAEVRLARLGQMLESDGLCGIREPLPAYVPKGPGSWKHAATGLAGDGDRGRARTRPAWSRAFEASDYRRVHDAIKQQRRHVTEVLLPRFDIRLA